MVTLRLSVTQYVLAKSWSKYNAHLPFFGTLLESDPSYDVKRILLFGPEKNAHKRNQQATHGFVA